MKKSVYFTLLVVIIAIIAAWKLPNIIEKGYKIIPEETTVTWTAYKTTAKVPVTGIFKDVIIEISKKRLGTTAVIDNDLIVGVITDGDLRRMLKDNDDISALTAKDIMSKNPKTIEVDAMAVTALETLEENNITQILAHDNSKYVGVVHLHDLLKEGIL